MTAKIVWLTTHNVSETLALQLRQKFDMRPRVARLRELPTLIHNHLEAAMTEHPTLEERFARLDTLVDDMIGLVKRVQVLETQLATIRADVNIVQGMARVTEGQTRALREAMARLMEQQTAPPAVPTQSLHQYINDVITTCQRLQHAVAVREHG